MAAIICVNLKLLDNIKNLGGSGGQAPAIVQSLAKDWTDAQGHVHHGIYDEENEFSVRWAEPFPACVAGCLKVVEPKKYRNSMFESAKLLVPMGGVKFPPACPKYDTLVLDDGTERKLSKAEIASLIQMDRMKEEMVSMVRIKTTAGNITYQLPPEKRGRMPDDRNYVAVMACWYIRTLREEQDLGDDDKMGNGRWFGESTPANNPVVNDKWDTIIKNRKPIGSRRSKSPFQGVSPFWTNNDKF